MPCHAAIEKGKTACKTSDTVEDVLKKIKKNKASGAAIIDDEKNFVGFFSKQILLSNLIPISVAMAGDIQLDIKMTAAPGVAKRLANKKNLPVSDLMDRKPPYVYSDAPIWQAVGIITKYGGPVCVVDEAGKFQGLITSASLLETLDKMLDTDE